MTRQHSTSRGQGRGPETAGSILLELDAEARAMPTWRKRALHPASEGVRTGWRGGTDLTGHVLLERNSGR
jgi:hypothetical protein